MPSVRDPDWTSAAPLTFSGSATRRSPAPVFARDLTDVAAVSVLPVTVPTPSTTKSGSVTGLSDQFQSSALRSFSGAPSAGTAPSSHTTTPPVARPFSATPVRSSPPRKSFVGPLICTQPPLPPVKPPGPVT